MTRYAGVKAQNPGLSDWAVLLIMRLDYRDADRAHYGNRRRDRGHNDRLRRIAAELISPGC